MRIMIRSLAAAALLLVSGVSAAQTPRAGSHAVGTAGGLVRSDSSNQVSLSQLGNSPIMGVQSPCVLNGARILTGCGSSGGATAPITTQAVKGDGTGGLVPLGYNPENPANRNQNGGYAGLDSTAQVLANQLNNMGGKSFTPAIMGYNPGSLATGSYNLNDLVGDAVGFSIRHFGAVMDGTTNDCPAVNAAIDFASQQWNQYRIQTPITLPMGHGRIYMNCAGTHPFADGVPGMVIGAGGHNSAVFQLGASFSGPLFSVSNVTLGQWPNVPGQINWSLTNAGPRFVGFTVAGVRPTNSTNVSPVVQMGIALYGNVKQAYLSDLDFYQLPGEMVVTGRSRPSNPMEGAITDESDFYALRGIETGLPASQAPDGLNHSSFDMDCKSPSGGGGDCFNQIFINKLRMTRNFGDCAWFLHDSSNSSRGARQVIANDVHIEDTYGGSGFCFGSTTDQDAVTAVLSAAVDLGSKAGYPGIRIQSPPGATLGNQPRNIVFSDLVSVRTNPGPNIDWEAGQGHRWTFSTFTETQWTTWTPATSVSANAQVSYGLNGYLYPGACTTGSTSPTSTSGTPFVDGTCTGANQPYYISQDCAICVATAPGNTVSGASLIIGNGGEDGFGLITDPKNDLFVPLYGLASAATGAPFSGGALTAYDNYIGIWNANGNTPALASGVAPPGGVQGAYRTVTVAGATSIDGNSVWNVGDRITWDATASIWRKLTGPVSNYSPPSIVNNRLMANVSGANAPPGPVSLSAMMDTIDATQGDLLFRNSLQWLQLGIGSPGQILAVNPGGTAPVWSTPNYLSATAPTYTGTMNGGALALTGSENVGGSLTVTGNTITNVLSAAATKTTAGGVLQAATVSGNSGTLGETSGTLISGHGAVFDANGNIVDSGSAPGGSAVYPGAGIGVSTGTGYGTSMAHSQVASYTPTLNLDTCGTCTVAYTTQTAKWSQIGSQVFVHGTLNATLTTGTGTGSVQLSLPAAAGSAASGPLNVAATGSFAWPGSAPTQLNMMVVGGAAYANLTGNKTSGVTTTMGTTNVCATSCAVIINFNGSYDTGSGS